MPVASTSTPAKSLLTEHHVAQRLNVSVGRVRRWRLQGEGPQYIKIGASVRYEPEHFEAWLASLPGGGTAEAERRAT